MKKWKVLHQGSESSGQKSVEDMVKIILENRGIGEIKDFLNPRLEDVTMKNVGIDEKEVVKTLELIKKTIKEEKAIVIYGDYDVDGICGTAILWETLYQSYRNVHPYMPHRINEGYGLSLVGISNIKNKIENIGLIITVDNGIVANKAVEYARSLGIKVIITDHHVKGAKMPRADAIVHTTELCGTSVAYLLSRELSVLSRQLSDSSNSVIGLSDQINRKPENLKQKTENRELMTDNHLELVALATVADLVPLNKYNRTLLKFGLEKLRKTKRSGLLALFEEAKINPSQISTYHIGHMIAPRLNASGRITHALDSLRLVCTKDEKKARLLAKHLQEVNRERQQLTMDSAEDARARIMKHESGIKNLLFVESSEYEQGVIGLIASKLVEEFYRPAIAVSVGEKISKGSARSIPGVNIIELIHSVLELLSEAGGHPMAAGFSIKTERLQEFKTKVISLADLIDKSLFERILTIDLELPWNMISFELYEKLQALAPFGMKNPTPTFVTRGVSIASVAQVGKDGSHLQILFEKDGDFLKGIKFGDGNLANIKTGDLVDIVYVLELNEWRGNRKVELKVRDIQPK